MPITFKAYVTALSNVVGGGGGANAAAAAAGTGLTPAQLAQLALAATAVQPAALTAAIANAVAQAVAQAGISLSGTQVTILDPAVFQLSAGQTPVATLINPPLTVDGTSIVAPGGIEKVNSLPFEGLAAPPAITASTQFWSVSNGTLYAASASQMALAFQAIIQPVVGIANIGIQAVSQPFTVSGTLTNESQVPTLRYADNAGTFQALPAGAVVTQTTFSFTHPGIATAGTTNTVTVQDLTNNVSSTSNVFAVSATLATAATLTGVPASMTHGVPFTAGVSGVTPATATVYACLLNAGVQETSPRVVVNCSGGTGTFTLTPAAAGPTYKIYIYAVPTGSGGGALAQTGAIVSN